jgi:hypothetical protein
MKIGLTHDIDIGSVQRIHPGELQKGELYYFTDYTGRYDEYWREIIGIFVSEKESDRTTVFHNCNTYTFKVIYCSKFSDDPGYKQLRVGSITRQRPCDLRLKDLHKLLDVDNPFIKTCLEEYNASRKNK